MNKIEEYNGYSVIWIRITPFGYPSPSIVKDLLGESVVMTGWYRGIGRQQERAYILSDRKSEDK